MKTIAIITARGGSKRIPRKNIKDFCGKPIIAYSIESAIESECFDEVMVSTDDEEIAEISRQFGAKVPFMRSDATANDYATTNDVLLEVLDEYKKRELEFDYHCCIYPTAPFITAEKLKNAMNLIQKNDVEYVATFAQFNVPPQWRCLVDEQGLVQFMEPDTILIRSQDLSPMYYDAGQFYIYDTKNFIAKKGRNFKKISAIKVPESEVQDIDTLDDWEMAEMKYHRMMAKGVAR